MGSYREHQNILKEFKVEACKAFDNIYFFDRHVGVFYTKNGTPISINKKGMADCYAILNKNEKAYHIEIEVKSGKAVLSKEQKLWRAFCQRNSVIYIELREVKVGIEELREKILLI